MIFLSLLVIPLVISVVCLIFGGTKFTLTEFLVQLVAQMAVAGISIAVIYHSSLSDTEVLNGSITGKERNKVSCSHSYSCHCYTTCSGSGKNRSCSQHCSTCYEHYYDVNWDVMTNIPGGDFRISRVNRQGTTEPPRWTAVQVGEPASTTHSYDNYIKAAPDTLFRFQGLVKKYEQKLPDYPDNIYDYHRLDRMVLVNGAMIPNLKEWNHDLAEVNAVDGPKKQANVVLVLVKGLPREYFDALSQHWLGGKKNDVIVVVGTPDNNLIDWVGVISWTDRQILKISLRDAILDVGNLSDRGKLLGVIRGNTEQYFVRKEMKDFQYLMSTVTPSPLQYTLAIIFGVLVAVGLGWCFYNYDPFDSESYNFNRRSR